MFLVLKFNGIVRLIINLKFLNRFVVSYRFRMEIFRSVLAVLKSGLWVVSIDLKDVYFYVLVYFYDRKFLRFVVLDKVW